jgi:hypothetical protein
MYGRRTTLLNLPLQYGPDVNPQNLSAYQIPSFGLQACRRYQDYQWIVHISLKRKDNVRDSVLVLISSLLMCVRSNTDYFALL